MAITYYTVHAADGPDFGAAQLGVDAKNLDEAREQFRYWRKAGAKGIRVNKHSYYAGSATEHETVCKWGTLANAKD